MIGNSKILASQTGLVEATLATSVDLDTEYCWHRSLKKAVRSNRQLLEMLGLTASDCSDLAESDFPVFAPREYIARMRRLDPHDPLLMQVQALPQEIAVDAGLLDPVNDQAAEIIPGLLQKYSGRALLITSGACAIHCRYCFRRHFPYSSAPTGTLGWSAAVQVISQDRSVEEIILSGGDPLSVADESLSSLIQSFNDIQHLRRIRIHTRFPVVIPSRVCQSLLKWVQSSRLPIYFVLHFNHANEIDSYVETALRSLRMAGATLLNQSVLLKGINDSTNAQVELCSRLINHQVVPYYLHQLDPVRGAMHFEVSDTSALEIIRQMRERLPGYAVPQLVREVAGQPHKTPI